MLRSARSPRAMLWPALLAMVSAWLGACGGGGGGDAAVPPGGGPGMSPPGIALLTPAAGPAGTQVRIEGIQFATTPGGNTVRFNGVPAPVLGAAPMELLVSVPAGATTGRVTVSTAGGSATSPSDFVVTSGSDPGATWTTRLQGPLGAPRSLAWNGTRLAAVGSNVIQASDDALIWTTRRSFASHADVHWDGRLFVAVGGDIDSSPDGLVWTTRVIGGIGAGELRGVTSSGNLWVAVGEGGAIVSSPDGVTWTARNSGTTQALSDVVWSGSRFIAVGANATVLASSDGIHWSPLAPAPVTLRALAWSGTLLAATAGSAIYTSPDGSVWTQRLANAGGQLQTIAHAAGRFVAAGFYASAASGDGLAWSTSGLVLGVLEGLAHDGNRWLAIATNGGSQGVAFSSPDGLMWTPRAVARQLGAIARSPLDGRVVAVGNARESQTSLDGLDWDIGYSALSLTQGDPFVDVTWAPSAGGSGAFIGLLQVAANQYTTRSTNGRDWTRQNPVPCRGALAASDTLILAVGSTLTSPCIASSPDGLSWTQRTLPAGLQPREAIWTGASFVAFGDGGTLATSPDGIDWTARASNVTRLLRGGGNSATLIVVVGDGGTIVTSADGGATWVPRSSGVTASLRRVAWTGSEFFVAGVNGTLLRSADGIAWTRQITQYTQSFGDIAWLPGIDRLLLVGDDGLTASSP